MGLKFFDGLMNQFFQMIGGLMEASWLMKDGLMMVT